MAEALFYLLALGALFAGGNVVFRRSPVVSTVHLVIVFFCLAGIYVLLGFPLVAAIQLLVYAGAILVLFLFVILLLNLRREEEDPPPVRKMLGPAVALGLGIVGSAIAAAYGARPIAAPDDPQDAAEAVGKELFSTYLIPFEATGLLLLTAVVGVILLSRKKEEGS